MVPHENAHLVIQPRAPNRGERKWGHLFDPIDVMIIASLVVSEPIRTSLCGKACETSRSWQQTDRKIHGRNIIEFRHELVGINGNGQRCRASGAALQYFMSWARVRCRRWFELTVAKHWEIDGLALFANKLDIMIEEMRQMSEKTIHGKSWDRNGRTRAEMTPAKRCAQHRFHGQSELRQSIRHVDQYSAESVRSPLAQ